MIKSPRMFGVSALVIFSLLLQTSGCASKPESRLVGKWKANVQGTLASEQFKALSAEQQEQGRRGLEIFSAATVEFRDDGHFLVEIPGMKEEGDWSISAVNGDVLTVQSKRSKDGKAKVFPARVTGNSVALTLFGDQPVLFDRQ